MPKTITLRLKDEVYKKFNKAAVEDNRSISNLIETLALKKLDEDFLVDKLEMEEILSNKALLKRLKNGHRQAKQKKGKMID